MGLSSSREASKQLEAAVGSFAPSERDRLRAVFRDAADESALIAWPSFHSVTESVLSASVQKRLFAVMRARGRRRESTGVDENGFYVTLSKLLRAPVDVRALELVQLAGGEPITFQHLEALLEDLINSYILVETDTAEFMTWRFSVTEQSEINLAHFILRDLRRVDTSATSYTAADVETWLQNTPLLLTMVDAIFSTVFNLKELDEELNVKSFQTPTIPLCVDADWQRFRSLLRVPSLLMLNNQLPAQLRRQWRLVFSSNVHGSSYATFVNRVNGTGPCVIVVKDRGGHVFGGFCSAGLQIGPNFRGDIHSFLFTLQPNMCVYRATGYNDNYAYMNVNQETLPNGVGIGGQLQARYFSLWLDKAFGEGCSQADGATFGSPQLSAERHFRFDELEVWSAGARPAKKEAPRPTSLLDSNHEARALLAMTGRGQLSDGLRESDAKAQSPGTHHELIYTEPTP